MLTPESHQPASNSRNFVALNGTTPISGWRPILRAYLVSIAIWGSLSLLTGWNYLVWDRDMNIRSTLGGMILLAESRGISYALLTPPIFFLVRRYSARSKHSVPYLSLCCLGVLPFMALHALIRWIAFPTWDPSQQQFVPRSQTHPFEFIHSSFADQITMYMAILITAHAYEYFVRARNQELERYQFQQALVASELQSLKMQLHPHFLFNTLHGITRLIDSDGRTAKEMVVKLSHLLRTALQKSGSDVVPLQDELAFAQEYLELEELRVGNRLAVTWSIPADTERMLVPQLILQPLIENAVRHGVAASRAKSWIEISSRKNDGFLELTIRNSVGAKATSGTGVGLRNTQARLKHMYAGEATFEFAVEGQIANATLLLPELILDSQEFSREETNPAIDASELDRVGPRAVRDYANPA